jgi:hypothetical protein
MNMDRLNQEIMKIMNLNSAFLSNDAITNM